MNSPPVILFLSTPSARRATQQRAHAAGTAQHFYPRPPRGGRPAAGARRGNGATFLSTPSARRATRCHTHPTGESGISIHALREEGDRCHTHPTGESGNFYPRPPRGGRPTTGRWALGTTYFYPRPPRGGRQQKQRENPLLLSYYTPPCTNCKEASANQTTKITPLLAQTAGIPVRSVPENHVCCRFALAVH